MEIYQHRVREFSFSRRRGRDCFMFTAVDPSGERTRCLGTRHIWPNIKTLFGIRSLEPVAAGRPGGFRGRRPKSRREPEADAKDSGPAAVEYGNLSGGRRVKHGSSSDPEASTRVLGKRSNGVSDRRRNRTVPRGRNGVSPCSDEE